MTEDEEGNIDNTIPNDYALHPDDPDCKDHPVPEKVTNKKVYCVLSNEHEGMDLRFLPAEYGEWTAEDFHRIGKEFMWRALHASDDGRLDAFEDGKDFEVREYAKPEKYRLPETMHLMECLKVLFKRNEHQRFTEVVFGDWYHECTTTFSGEEGKRRLDKFIMFLTAIRSGMA